MKLVFARCNFGLTGSVVVHVQVTILVAAEGTHKLQPINGTVDMKEALQKIGSIPRNKIMVRVCICKFE